LLHIGSDYFFYQTKQKENIMDVLTSINDLNQMVLEGKAMEAFEKYYAENCSMRENGQEPTIGKDANRKREEEFFSKITEFRGAEVLNVTASNDVTMVEWKFDYTHADWGDRKYNQVAVQRWKDGQIVDEKYYYGS
jgi:hypothetical protein